MLRSAMLAGAMLTILVLPVPTVRANAADAPAATQGQGISLDLGRRDFDTYCASCHGVSGKGDGTIAEFLTITAPDLTQLSRMSAGKFPRDRLREVIDGRAEVRIHGPRDMPVWGDWFDVEARDPDTDSETRAIIVRDRIESLLNYIETLQGN